MANPVDIEGLRLFMTRQVSGFVEILVKPKRRAGGPATIRRPLENMLCEIEQRAAAKRAGRNPDEQPPPSQYREKVN